MKLQNFKTGFLQMLTELGTLLQKPEKGWGSSVVSAILCSLQDRPEWDKTCEELSTLQ